MIKHNIILYISLLFPIICLSQLNKKDTEGRRDGKWKVNFEGTNKPKFEGTFEHGKRIGEFKFYKRGFYEYPSAIMDFGKGNDTVSVTYYTQQGKPISKGKMLDKEREGKWIYFHKDSDSIMMSEIYKDDQLNGLQVTYFPNSQIAEKTLYKNGEKEGESLIYSEKGQLMKKLQYHQGELNGHAIYYNSSGEKMMEGDYSMGEKTGSWKYYKDGKLDEEKEF
ncbi:aspartic peptidase [Christiangramia fulva]|uniref:Aspartic peptidase n=1 Tax=Christiangramia fulva TaxID=2126553 RepID=A0A2R3Z6J0_9FLAO|nr:aspartic peptidase [Christiangramia fulva]AVR45879.1 aspartic peptidase [Christiangramia fulva]